MLDNASTDGTGEIIRRYAAKDPRVAALRNEVNHVYEEGNSWVEIISGYDDSDYLCFLDADDEYKPEFLAETQRFLWDYDLDVAACGYEFIDESTKNVFAVRKLEQDLIIDTPEKFSDYFPAYYLFIRTAWCKLYKLSVLRKFDLSRISGLSTFGMDTLFAIESFRNANRAGILAKSLHKYHVSPQSASYGLDDTRVICDRTLDGAARAFLMEKCGQISPWNHKNLQRAFYFGTIDTIIVLIKSDLPPKEKLANLCNLLTNAKTRELFQQIDIPDEQLDFELRDPIFKWLLQQKEYRNLDSVETIVEILTSIYPRLSPLKRKEALKRLLLESPDKFLE